MAPKTPKLTELNDELAEAYRTAIALALADGRITPAESQVLHSMLDVLQGLRWWNQQRVECVYVLDHGTPEPPSAWHARLRRELDQLDAAERAELHRLTGQEAA